jgi:hypothetical protein
VETSGSADSIRIKDLRLDPQNPRLAEFGVKSDATQDDLVKVLWERMAVVEVAMSIAYSGFFQHEPLFAEKAPNGKFVVIEGNRRLAAVRLLIDGELRKKLHATDLPTVSAQRLEELKSLPVIVTDRKSLWRYLGFKHVNGPATWGSYAKAQYIAQVHNTYKVPLADIAAQIGDYNSTVERMYRGLMIIEQAEEAKVFARHDVSRSRFHFNFIYTGMDFPGISTFIGLQKKASTIRKPVPKEKIKELGELLGWLYGTRTGNKESLIHSQNPDLKNLDGVLQSGKGIAALRDGLPLQVAMDISVGDPAIFRQSLQNAKQALQRALGTLTTGYDTEDSDMDRLALDLETLSHDVVDAMRQKKNRERKRLADRV